MAWLKGPRGTGDFIEVGEPVRFMDSVEFMDTNPVGTTYYVQGGEGSPDVEGSDSNQGTTPGTAFRTLSYAVHSVAQDWDKIIVLSPYNSRAYLVEAVQATDDANVPITITQRGLKIIGDQVNRMTYGTPTVHTHVAANGVFNVLADNVEIAGLTIQVQGAGGWGIKIGAGATTNRCVVHHCCFAGYGATISGILFGAGSGAGNDAPYTVVDTCRFTGFTNYGVVMSAGDGSVIQNCVFDKIPAGGEGVHCTTTAAQISLPQHIRNNVFVGADNTNSSSGSAGIIVGASVPGEVIIDGNSFIYFGADMAITNETEGQIGVNYLNGVLLLDD